jgi:predicted DNA-binding transcriptional regulator YafY
MGVLRDAVDHRKPLWIGYVDADGGTTHRMIEPVAMSSGAIVAYDRLRGAVRTFVLHRITGVRPVSDDELETVAEPETAADAVPTDAVPTDAVPTDADGSA